jgi:hypothetical protein
MRKQQYISIQQRCPLGHWHSLPRVTALDQIINDLFNSRMEDVYPYHRPECAQT